MSIVVKTAKILLASVSLCALIQGTARAGVFNPETAVLANGMEIVVIPNNITPAVTQMLWYKVGSGEEVPGKSGLAHFLEHLMFKATKTRAAGEFSKNVIRMGGVDNAFTSTDYTAFFQQVPASGLEEVMKMEADRMVNLNLTDQVFNTEKQVVLAERQQTIESNPVRRLFEQAQAMLYVNHPYGRPVIGWEDEIKNLSREDAENFYRTWYAPNNVTLVVSGDVSLEKVKTLAEKYFGTIPRKDLPKRNRPPEPVLAGGERRLTVKDAQTQRPVFYRLFSVEGYRTAHGDQGYAMDLLVDLLGGHESSRLYRRLVLQEKKALSIGMSYRGEAYDQGMVSISAEPAPGVDNATLEKAIQEELDKIAAQPPEDSEIADSKRRMLDSAIQARDSVEGPAHVFGIALSTGQKVQDVESWPKRVEAVPKEALAEAATRLVKAAQVHAWLLPDGTKPVNPNAAPSIKSAMPSPETQH